jgi:putative isomerase
MPLHTLGRHLLRPAGLALDLGPVHNDCMLRFDVRNLQRSYWVALVSLCLQLHAASAAQTVPTKGGGASEAHVQYRELQRELAKGWNTWHVNSMTTYVLLPESLAIHVGFLNNGNNFRHEYLTATSVGQGTAFPGPHSWDGSYTELNVTWKGHRWRLQTAHEDADLVLLVTLLDPLERDSVPATVAFQVDFLWDQPGTALKRADSIETHGSGGKIDVYCASEKETSCNAGEVSTARPGHGQLPVSGAYLAAALTESVGVSTGKRRSVAEIAAIVERQRATYRRSVDAAGIEGPTVDAIETTLGWDTIYEPEHTRVISPVSRDWSANWGGYVLFGWDTFFGATLAGLGDKELAYANVIEGLHERRRGALCRTTRGRVNGRVRTVASLPSGRSQSSICTGSIMIAGFWRRRTSLCCAGIDGGHSTATFRAI